METSFDAIRKRLRTEPGTLADFEAEYGPVQPSDGEGRSKARTNMPAAESRSRSKSSSRAADGAALTQGLKTVRDVKRENEVLAPLAKSARIDLSASRRLA
jgi:hypothetical protein